LSSDLYSNWLPDERYTWKHEIEQGFWHEPYVLQQYRANRDSNLWRSTREVEKLCEYILYLEGARPVTESTKVTCDNCEMDLSITHTYPEFSLRLTESMIAVASGAIQDLESTPELDQMKNFCNLHCLKQWSKKE